MAEPATSVYADATSLIGLARVDRLDLLDLLPTPVRVTAEVWREATGDAGKPGVAALQAARERELLQVVEEGDPSTHPELDAGEATVLSAAAAARGAVLLDERKARSLLARESALREAIPQASGIVGLILLAKRRGRISAVRPLIQDLVRQSFWISPRFYQEILRLAGERLATESPHGKSARRQRKAQPQTPE